MKTLLIVLISACTAMMAHAAETGQKLPKLSKILPGAAFPDTAGKVVIIDFWASWCAPCKASFPAFNRLHDKYSAKGLVIIGVGLDDDVANYKEFSGKMGAKFTLAHDAEKKAAAFFSPPSMPTSYVIDRKGVIRHVHTGFRGAKTETELSSEIEALLSVGG